MPGKGDSNYYADRALTERRMMEAATDPRAVSSHAELAARYEALASYPSLNLLSCRSATG
ncbi:MAG: hypothetical protein ABI626_07005 [Sphingomicrobium sp.]